MPALGGDDSNEAVPQLHYDPAFTQRRRACARRRRFQRGRSTAALGPSVYPAETCLRSEETIPTRPFHSCITTQRLPSGNAPALGGDDSNEAVPQLHHDPAFTQRRCACARRRRFQRGRSTAALRPSVYPAETRLRSEETIPTRPFHSCITTQRLPSGNAPALGGDDSNEAVPQQHHDPAETRLRSEETIPTRPFHSCIMTQRLPSGNAPALGGDDSNEAVPQQHYDPAFTQRRRACARRRRFQRGRSTAAL